MPTGEERPVGFVSKSLSKEEKNYTQVEKEGLACVFGIKSFHSYQCGRPFTLRTDYKPLFAMFSESHAVTPQASGRIQRLLLFLSNYEYQIKFRPTM